MKPSLFDRIDHRVTALSQILAMLGLALLIAFAAATALDVLLRSVFNAPIRGLSDVGNLIMILAVTAGIPANIKLRQNVTIEMLGKLGAQTISRRSPAVLNTFGALVTLGFICLLCWRMADYAIHMGMTSETTLILGLSLAPWWWVGAVFAGVSAVCQVLVVIQTIRSVICPEEDQ